MKKIVLAGPPRSGKSCLREGLKQAIRAIPSAPYPYVITACPDGEGAWFQATMDQNPRLAAECKAAYKAKFTPAFVKRVSESVCKCAEELTLVDIGGITSAENKEICAGATHIVILAGRPGAVAEWRQFARELNLKIVAEIHSAYVMHNDIVKDIGPDAVLKGSVHYLERGVDVSKREMVKALAGHVVNL
jgi:CRISPR-associated protein Csx3